MRKPKIVPRQVKPVPAEAAPVVETPPAVTPEPAPAPVSEPKQESLREREAARTFALAVSLHRRGEFEQAITAYSRALNLSPDNGDIYNNLGVCLRSTGKMAAAATCYMRALVLKPNDPGTLSNLGNIHRDMGDLQSAITLLSKAVKLTPNAVDAMYNLGLSLRDVGEMDKAMSCFESASTSNPNYLPPAIEMARTRLMNGDLKGGFVELEKRLQQIEGSEDFPRWDGSPLGGKTLLIRQEGGLGDVIQFARYFAEAKSRGANVVVECHARLVRLIAMVEGVDKVVIANSTLPHAGVYIPLMSLPHVLDKYEVSADFIPYLRSPTSHALHLPPSAGKQIRAGLCWSPGVTRPGSPDRSCELSRLIELLAIPGLKAFSLQTGDRRKDMAEYSCDALITDLGSKINDLADLCAAIDQLDLVICVDSVTAHIAGALGKPVWVLLPFSPDWRWYSTSEDCAWYPSARLFKQSYPNNWDNVFEALHAALYTLVNE